jgi:copper(I)-binding protein
MSPRPRPVAAALAAATLWLAACSPPASLVAHDAWVRAVPPGATATAGYLVLENGSDREYRLTSVEADGIARVEIHETSMQDGVMRMRPVDAIPVPAGSNVALSPGGQHLMLFADSLPREGDTVTLALRFDDGTALTVEAPVRRGGEN